MSYKIKHDTVSNTLITEKTNANPAFEYKKGIMEPGLLYIETRYPTMENPEANHVVEYHIYDCMNAVNRDIHVRLRLNPFLSNTDPFYLERLKLSSSLIGTVSLRGILTVPPEILAQIAVQIEIAEQKQSDTLPSTLFKHPLYGEFYRLYLIGLVKQQTQ